MKKTTLHGFHSPRGSVGFSLIEMMVAIVAGMVVAGAILAFTLSSLRVNSEYIRATKLSMELRNSINFVTEELRRAGYDEDALAYISRPPGYTGFSPFSTISIVNPGASNGCIVYAYDRLPGNAGVVDLSNGEVRAIRRVQRTSGGRSVGVIEFAESKAGLTPSCTADGPDYATYPATCNSTTGWCALSDPRVIDVTSLSFNRPSAGFPSVPGSGGNPGFQLRQIAVDIQGSLLDSNVFMNAQGGALARGVNAVVRVRADCIRTNPAGNCALSPTGT